MRHGDQYDAAIVRMYERHISPDVIGDSIGVSAQFVRDRLIANKVKFRAIGHPWHKSADEQRRQFRLRAAIAAREQREANTFRSIGEITGEILDNIEKTRGRNA